MSEWVISIINIARQPTRHIGVIICLGQNVRMGESMFRSPNHFLNLYRYSNHTKFLTSHKIVKNVTTYTSYIH